MLRRRNVLACFGEAYRVRYRASKKQVLRGSGMWVRVYLPPKIHAMNMLVHTMCPFRSCREPVLLFVSRGSFLQQLLTLVVRFIDTQAMVVRVLRCRFQAMPYYCYGGNTVAFLQQRLRNSWNCITHM